MRGSERAGKRRPLSHRRPAAPELPEEGYAREAQVRAARSARRAEAGAADRRLSARKMRMVRSRLDRRAAQERQEARRRARVFSRGRAGRRRAASTGCRAIAARDRPKTGHCWYARPSFQKRHLRNQFRGSRGYNHAGYPWRPLHEHQDPLAGKGADGIAPVSAFVHDSRLSALLPNYTPVGALGTRHAGIKRLPDEPSQFFDDERLLDEGGGSD